MGAIFYDSTIIEYDDTIHLLDGTESVGNDDGSTVFHQIGQAGLDELFGLAVEC